MLTVVTLLAFHIGWVKPYKEQPYGEDLTFLLLVGTSITDVISLAFLVHYFW